VKPDDGRLGSKHVVTLLVIYYNYKKIHVSILIVIMFYNVCYDGKEYNGVLRERKRNAEIQIIPFYRA
jgi:hypothetical protein